VIKKNKAVILISTNHHDDNYDLDSRKPEIIIDYNKYKGIILFIQLLYFDIFFANRGNIYI
jgi:hypothetical protein